MRKTTYKKVLILGSGALKIGQAGEFDYSGSQAMKALREEKIATVLINPNIATIQTSKELADEVYFLPVTPYFVEKVIQKEKPDGILLSFGGQTALNCGIALHKNGILEKYGVTILGTPISAIILTEDREEFARHLRKIDISTPISQIATSVKEALKVAESISYPVMIRAGYALGGQGSGVAYTSSELEKIVTGALAFAPQVLIERYLHHYKEIEYEVVRDAYDNCITVCNMENMDPLGIHTGDSIVVAPSQTLTNNEYHSLREASIKIVRSLGIVGECNVQFALNPRPKNGELEYYVIEVNARLSRSSALASKATGYPLAYIAAKLALQYNLTHLSNNVTRVTQACFEPALDYVVVKIPRWDLDKFKGADKTLGSGMKSVGEVMGIGRTFEEAYQKALRMLDLNYEGATNDLLFAHTNDQQRLDGVRIPTPTRMFALSYALRKHLSIKKMYELSGIDPWFLYRIKNIVDEEELLRKNRKLDAKRLLHLKQLGFSDKRIGELTGRIGLEVRGLRKYYGVRPSVLQIDTLAGEFPAKTNYLYMTYNASHSDVTKTGDAGVVVLGSGPYRIGSSVEFDWCSVNTVMSLKKYNKKSIVINCNPETVSTDYDISDRLYFEELTFERITDIYEFESPYGIIVSVGGQTPNNRAPALHKYGLNILGTDPTDIDRAEDRSKFSHLLDELEIKQPYWKAFTTITQAEKFAEKVGYPVLIRPSYVLSGSAMNICYSKQDLSTYIHEATRVSTEYPVTVSKFFEKTKEVEFDAIAQHGEVKAYVITEHIENAGVHSGDASIILPTRDVTEITKKKIIEAATKLVKALRITGPLNIQFLARNDEVFIIEINIRAARTFPFVSKVTGVNFISLFVDCLFQDNVKTVTIPTPKFFAVKVAEFSFSRISKAHMHLGVEMASTGEVACFGQDVEEAFLKSMMSVGFKIPKKGVLASIASEEKKEKMATSLKQLAKLGLPMYTTQGTAQFLKKHGVNAIPVAKVYEGKHPNTYDCISEKKVDFVINIVSRYLSKAQQDDYILRRAAIDNNIFLLTKLRPIRLLIQAITNKKVEELPILPWSAYN